ncbi:MAG: SUMF1/EgtB/PvdO family nonheme iron enzyme [Ginsengibacter sp.]
MAHSRQLAAIMFTDIVGYTTLMGEDEQKAFEMLRRNRHLQKPIIEEHNGKWIKELGDGILATFSTVTDAVACACLIQKECNSTDDLKLRIGIHQGEVIFEDDDVFGDSVNIASRLQALAPIGGIWISESVYKNISNKKGIKSIFIREEALKNVKEQVKIYEVDIESFQSKDFEYSSIDKQVAEKVFQKNTSVPLHDTAIKAAEKEERIYPTQKTVHNRKKIIAWSLPVFVIAILLLLFLPSWMNKQRARNELIPEIKKLTEDNFFTTKTFDLAKEAEKYISKDSALLKLWPQVAWPFSFKTSPAGASVYWKDYDDTKEEWKLIGKTPLESVLIPKGFTRIKIEKTGFKTMLSPPTMWRSELDLKLDRTGKFPESMVKVSGSETLMLIVGLEQYGGKYVNDFLMDKYEVTNKDFKSFVDAGGYRNKTYWEYPVSSEDKIISFEQAMNLFYDKTGKPGPAGWEVGTYPDGKGNHPVTGISWYEAMAYAKFAGKKLPTVYHWSMVANTINTWGIIPKSNFNGIGTVPVGSLDGISDWGVYDIAGNAREWCLNETGRKGECFILGGGWNDQTYAFNDGNTQLALDRSLSNGFRCMKELPGDTSYDKLSGPIKLAFRNYQTEKPVNDETFNIFLRQYVYDRTPLNSKVEKFADTSLCKVEKIDIDAAYNKERLTAYLYLPKNTSPPYQTIVYFPGSGVIHDRKFDFKSDLWVFDFILKSGRAVCYPILKGTFERGDELRSDLQEQSVFYKEHVISWVKDFSRCLDYLETRKDIVNDKFGYYGLSWGSAMAPVMCAVEKRFKTAVLHVGGLMMTETFPEVDPFNFLPPVKIPVLMLNGENDTFYPLETSQRPLFNFIGTDTENKKMFVYPGGHLVPRSELMKESLLWFDKYLGEIK